MPHALRTNDSLRIIAAENGTSVTINGGPPIALNAGQFVTDDLFSAPAHIVSNSQHPILVTQFEQGVLTDLGDFAGHPTQTLRDPSMMIVYPYEQFLSEYTVTTPSGAGFDDWNFSNLTVPRT